MRDFLDWLHPSLWPYYLILLGVALFWGSIVYVAWHFIVKFW